MPNELTAGGLESGLVVTASLMLAGAVVASGIVATESAGVLGFYAGSVPPATPEALYTVLFLSGGKTLAQGLLDWTGAAERVLASQASVSAIPTTPLLAGGYTAPNNTGISTLLSRVTAAVPLASDWTPARAGKIDNLDATVSSRNATAPDNTGVATLLSRVTAAVPLASDWTPSRAAKIDNLDATVSSRNATAPDNVGILAAIAGISGGGGATAAVVADTVLAAQAGNGTVRQALAKINVTPANVPVVVIPGAPAAAAVCRVYGYLRTVDNKPAANVAVQFDLVAAAPIKSTALVSGRRITARTNAQGQLTNEDGSTAYVDLVRYSSLTPAGSYYTVSCRPAMLNDARLTLDSDLFDIATIVTG